MQGWIGSASARSRRWTMPWSDATMQGRSLRRSLRTRTQTRAAARRTRSPRRKSRQRSPPPALFPPSCPVSTPSRAASHPRRIGVGLVERVAAALLILLHAGACGAHRGSCGLWLCARCAAIKFQGEGQAEKEQGAQDTRTQAIRAPEDASPRRASRRLDSNPMDRMQRRIAHAA